MQAVETFPQMHLNPEDIACFTEKLKHYQDIYSRLFQRPEQRNRAFNDLQSLLLNIPCKFIEPMGLTPDGVWSRSSW
jgi:hypothetical protein